MILSTATHATTPSFLDTAEFFLQQISRCHHLAQCHLVLPLRPPHIILTTLTTLMTLGTELEASHNSDLHLLTHILPLYRSTSCLLNSWLFLISILGNSLFVYTTDRLREQRAARR